MILAKEFDGELWIKASDHYDDVNRSVAAEREACAKLAYELTSYEGIAEAIRARGNPDLKKYLASKDAWRFIP